MLRLRHVRLTILLGVLIAGPASLDAAAQSDPGARLLRPVPDGDPRRPQKFSRSSMPNTIAPGRFGAPRPFGSPPDLTGHQPGFGAGGTGYVSTNARRLRPRTRAALIVPARRSHPALSSRPGQPTIAAPPQAGFPLETPGTLRRRAAVPEADAFAPVGIRAGSFIVRPAVELWGAYDSNPGRTRTPQGSWLTTVAPELQVRSEWSRHQLNADLRGTYTAYEATPELNRPYLDGKVAGRFDIGSDSRFEGEGRLLLSTDNPGSPNVQAGLSRFPIYTTTGASAGVGHRFNRLDIALRGSVDRTVYGDSNFTDGTTASNADRNYTQYGAQARATYELSPGLKPFVEIGTDKRVRDVAIDRTGLHRDSSALVPRVGAAFAIGSKLTGEASVGYLTRRYEDPALPELRGLIGDASLVYAATALTTVTLNARSSADEMGLVGVSGVLRRDVGLQVDHAFRRWLIGTIKLGVGLDDYDGLGREDQRYSASAGVTYKMTRTLQFKGELRRDWMRSNVTGVDYTANIALVGLRLQR